MRGDTIYAWQEKTDEGWGIIAAALPAVADGIVPLVSRDLPSLENVASIARLHVEATGNELRLAAFELAEVLQ